MKNFKIEPRNILETFRIEEESNTYIYNLNGKKVLLKLFTTDNEEKLESKRKKIEIMSENKAINDEMGNIGNAIFDGKIVGYFMPIDMEYVRPISEYDRRKDKIVVLKRLKEKVEKLNENGVFIGDFDKNDILINYSKDNILLFNLDKCKIDGMDFDKKSENIDRFNEKCKNQGNIDSYTLNLFTIELLERIYKPYVVNYLISNELPKYLDTKVNRSIIREMNSLNDSYQKRYLIDDIHTKRM